jgi:hypothetical protein
MPTTRLDSLPKTSKSEAHESPAQSLARIAANLQTIAAVLGEYPARNPDAWNSPEWAKELKDLQIACERLQEYARRVDDLSTRLANGRAGPR